MYTKVGCLGEVKTRAGETTGKNEFSLVTDEHTSGFLEPPADKGSAGTDGNCRSQ
jgi:hypothetical protein